MKALKWGLAATGVLAGLATLALAAGAFGGVAQAQQPQDPQARHARYQELLAQQLGISVDELTAAQKAARYQMIDEALAAGRITAEQAERMKNAQPGEMRRAAGQRIKNAVLHVFDAAASILGLSKEEIRTGLQEGKSLNDLAEEQGVGNFEAQLTARLTAEIQQKLAEGAITQQQADRLLENLAERVARIVEREGGTFRHRFGPR